MGNKIQKVVRLDEIMEMIQKLSDATALIATALAELTTRVNKLESLILRTYNPPNDLEIH